MLNNELKGIPKLVSELLKGYPDTLDIYLRFVKPINFLLVYTIGWALSTFASNGNGIFFSVLMIAWLYVMIFVLGGMWGFDTEDSIIGVLPDAKFEEKPKVVRERKPIKFSAQQINVLFAIMGFALLLLSSYVSFIQYLQLGFVLCGVMLIVIGLNGLSGKNKTEKSNILEGEEY